MNFAHTVQPDPLQGRYRVESEIDRVTIQVVQIEQLTASGQRDDPPHQTELIADLRIGRQIRQIVHGIFQQEGHAIPALNECRPCRDEAATSSVCGSGNGIPVFVASPFASSVVWK